MVRNLLVVFDFDDTIIEGNSDAVAEDLSPGGLPNEITSLIDTEGWNKYMGEVFRHLHKQGIDKDQILSGLEKVPFVPGMAQLFRCLANPELKADVVILSDANLVFISHILQVTGLYNIVQKIYTNPAWFDDRGCLNINFYHKQNWCTISPINMCKGHILTSHLNEQKLNGVTYKQIAYVGDGSNDYCAALRLSSSDIVFPRKGFHLLEKIKKQGHVKAKVSPWQSGEDIWNVLQVYETTLER